jgi:hypothetical protein
LGPFEKNKHKIFSLQFKEKLINKISLSDILLQNPEASDTKDSTAFLEPNIHVVGGGAVDEFPCVIFVFNHFVNVSSKNKWLQGGCKTTS